MKPVIFKWIIYWSFICSFSLSAQNLTSVSGNTYAVVVGISDYQDEGITDLRFADKDAAAFAAYLQSPAGGSLPSDNIMLLTNEAATTGAIASSMDWLIADCKEGDRAIIYFSGHGDVETRTRFQRGFLLTYDSPPSNYLAGAFALIFLQDIITTLSEQGVQVVMVSDACRAGKLAGSEIGGPQATAANLSKQYANEIKILSCQPDEFSLEGEQWGGGRGAFSYHLIDALTGMADGNTDLKVNLLEVNRYLEETVPAETDPHMQIPMTVGSKGTVIAYVDEASLTVLQQRKEKELPTMTNIETKGFEDLLLAEIDSIWQKKYEQFTVALENGKLLEPAGTSAYDLYSELSNVSEMGRLHGIMKRNLATALQDESQQAINAYLRGDEEEFAARTRGELRYTKFVRYLEKAAELLGEKHYMYKSLKAKQYYFDAVDTRYRFANRTFAITDSTQIWREHILNNLNKALELEEHAAFIIHDLGLHYGAEGIPYFEKAIELAPQWVFPYAVLSVQYLNKGDLDSARIFAQNVYKLAPESSIYPSLMSKFKQAKGEFAKEEALLLEALQISPKNIQYMNWLSGCYFNQKKYREAEEVLLQIIEWVPEHIQAYNGLSTIYLRLKEYDKAEAICRKRLEMRPTDGDAYWDLVNTYWGREPEKIKALITEMKAINEQVENWEGQQIIANAYRGLGERDKAIEYYEKARNATPKSPWLYYRWADLYHNKGDYETFLTLLDTAFINGIWLSYVENYSNVPAAFKSPSYQRFAEKTIERFPKYGFGYNLMGKYFEGLGDFPTAAEYYEQALTFSPERRQHWFAYGKVAYLNGEKENADSAFKKCIEVSDQLLSQYNGIGYFYRIHSEYELAEKYLIKTLEKDSSNLSAIWNLAWVHFSTDRKTEAYALLDQSIDLQSSKDNKASLFYLRGLFAHYSGQAKESLEWFGQAAVADEKYMPLATAVEKVLEADYEAASGHFKEAMKTNPGADNMKYIFCQLKIEQGDYAGALDLLEKALAIGGRTYDFMANDPKLDPIREIQKYHELMQLYFPEKTKH